MQYLNSEISILLFTKMSSSESEDENIKNLLEAVDPTLMNDAMFKSDLGRNDLEKDQPSKPIERPKSNRFLVEEENVFQSDINVTESMKKFVGQKLSAIIDQKITFVDSKQSCVSKMENSCENSGVRLLRDSDTYLKVTDGDEKSSTLPKNNKMKVLKRSIEADCRDEKEKLRISSIELATIVKSTNLWTNRPKAIVYQYKRIGSVNTIQDTHEFSQLKRRNNWDESKIKSFRFNNKRR